MEFKTPRDLRSEETKLNILLTTDEFITKHGIDALTVKNLCACAGISNGSFFHYFSSKDALVAEYMHFAYDRFLETNPFVGVEGDHLKNIVDTHLHNIRYAKTLGVEFTRCYYTVNNPNLHNRDNMQAEAYSRYVLDQLDLARQKGYITSDQTDETIGADICMVAKGTIFEWALCGDSFDVEDYLDRMLRLYLRSVATEAYFRDYPDF